MVDFLALIPLFPLLGFLILVLSQGKLAKNWVPIVGVGSIGLSALLTAGIALCCPLCLQKTDHLSSP